MSDDNRAELARLIGQELEESRRGPAEITKGWTDSAVRSFYGWKDGSTAPLARSRGMLEDALGWRRGVVTDILEAPITREEFTLSEVRDWSKIPEPKPIDAKGWSFEDVLGEVSHRYWAAQTKIEALEDELGELRLKLRAAEESRVVPLRSDQSHYDLAASDEHVPGEDDRD